MTSSTSSMLSYRDSAPLCTVYLCPAQLISEPFVYDEANQGWAFASLGSARLRSEHLVCISPSGLMGDFGRLWTAAMYFVSLFWQACSIPLKAPIVLSGYDKSVQRGQATTHTRTQKGRGGTSEPLLGLLHNTLH